MSGQLACQMLCGLLLDRLGLPDVLLAFLASTNLLIPGQALVHVVDLFGEPSHGFIHAPLPPQTPYDHPGGGHEKLRKAGKRQKSNNCPIHCA